jgi:hypothetical protein
MHEAVSAKSMPVFEAERSKAAPQARLLAPSMHMPSMHMRRAQRTSAGPYPLIAPPPCPYDSRRAAQYVRRWNTVSPAAHGYCGSLPNDYRQMPDVPVGMDIVYSLQGLAGARSSRRSWTAEATSHAAAPLWAAADKSAAWRIPPAPMSSRSPACARMAAKVSRSGPS